jgi:hypothetical protein
MPAAALILGLVMASSADASAPLDAGESDGAGSEAGSPDGMVPESEAVAAPPSPPAPVAPRPPPVSLAGTVWEKGTRRPLAGASVTVDAAPAGESDEAGSFAVLVPAGRHVIEIQLPGFEILRETVEVPDTAAPRAFRLTPRPGDRRYITVVAPPGQSPRISLSGQEARETPGAAGDPFRSIESLPGVAQVAWPLALYAIRGANPGNTGFFVDGMRVPALFHFALGPSIIHPYLIERVDFYPGGYPARLGGYVSGVVTSETVSPPSDLAHGSVDVRVYDAGALVTTPFDGGRGTVAIAGRYSYTGQLARLFFSDVKFGYGDYQVRVDHPLGGGRFTALALGSADELSVRQRRPGDGSLQFHRLDLRWDRPIGPGRLRLRSVLGSDWASTTFGDAPISIRAYSIAPGLEYGARLGPGLEIEGGVKLEAQRFRPQIPPMPGSPTFDDLARARGALTSAAHASLVLLPFGPRLELSPGVRVVQYAEQGITRLTAEPRFSVLWKQSSRLSLKAVAGRFTQMASLPIGVPGFDAFDLRDLGLQRSLQGSLGGSLAMGDLGQLDLTGFYQQVQVSDLRSIVLGDFRQMSFLEMRPGRGYGLELLLRRPESHRLHGWLAYTLSRSERRVDGVWGASDWDQRHIFNLLASYDLGRGYSLGGRVHLNTGRPVAVSPGGNRTQIDYRRLPAFYQLDLRAAKRMIFDRFTLTVYVELGNVTLSRQVTEYSSGFDANDRPLPDGVVEQLGYRIVLPTVGIHGEI